MEPVFDPYEHNTIPPIVTGAALDPELTRAWPGGEVIREEVIGEVDSAMPIAVEALPAIPLTAVTVDHRPIWPLVAAAVALALVLGGIGGYLIGATRNRHTTTATTTSQPVITAIASAPATAAATAAPDTRSTPATAPDNAAVVNATLDSLLSETKSAAAFPTPSPYPQLDQIIAIQTAKDTATLQAQIDTLNAAHTQATEQATTMQAQLAAAQASLADTQKQRDDLTAQLAKSTASSADLQQQIASRDQQIASLQTAAATAKTSLDTANAALAKANTDLETAKNQLAAANAVLTKLNPKTLTSYVNGDVGKARSDANANGWTIIEKQTASTSIKAGTVTAQTPASGATMVTGSVLYVEVAIKPA